MNNLIVRPVLITLTGPTCSGKTTIQNLLVERGIQRIVSTTTRKPRQNEINGVDYHFISERASLDLERSGEFAELVTFNNTRYGVTHHEATHKLCNGALTSIILEPNGVDQYEELCRKHGALLFTVYVHTELDTRIARLSQRFKDDLRPLTQCGQIEASEKTVDTYVSRLTASLGEELKWNQGRAWNLTVFGNDGLSTETVSRIVANAEEFQRQDYVVQQWHLAKQA